MIIIVDTEYNAKQKRWPLNSFTFLEEGFAYLSFVNISNSVCDLFSQKKVIRLNAHGLSNTERKEILKDYVDFIGNISTLNSRDREWWATDIASKNRVLSPVQEVLNQVIFFLKAIDECNKKGLDLYVIGVKWPVISFIEEFVKSKIIELQVKSRLISRVDYKISFYAEFWMYFAKSVLSSSLAIIQAYISFSNIRRIERDGSVFLIKSWVFPKAFSGDKYHDPFVGSLPLDLRKYLDKDTQIVTISQGYSDKFKCYKKMNNNDRLIFPVERFLYLSDVFLAGLSISWYMLFKSINIPNSNLLLGNDVTPTLKEIVKTSGKFIRFGEYLYYYLGRRIAFRYTLKGCLMSYEGNHWEKMFILGLRSVSQDVKIIGHHHSAITQASAGSFISKSDIAININPNYIVTTGKESAKILKKYSHFPVENIFSGCAPLYQYLYNFSAFLKRGPPSRYTVLVMLEGVLEARVLLQYAISQAMCLPYVKFLVRSHPSLPIESLLKNMETSLIELPGNIYISDCDKVSDDVERSDVGLYWGTATAVENLMMGRPIIWFDRGDVLSFDPLFDFSEFKWVVNSETSIIKTLKEINNLEDKVYESKANKGIKYVSQYLEKCTSEKVKLFR